MHKTYRMMKYESLLVISLCLKLINVYAVNVTNSVPYYDSFESYNSGDRIIGSAGWYAGNTNFALVTNITYSSNYTEPSHRYPLGSAGDRVLKTIHTSTNLVTNAVDQIVWIDYVINPTYWDDNGTPSISASAQAAYYVNTNGQFVLRHGDPAGPEPLWTTISNTFINTDDWVRITIKMDYQTEDAFLSGKYFQFFLNGVVITNTAAYTDNAYADTYGGSWFAMIDRSRAKISQISFSGINYLDNLVVTNGGPYPQLHLLSEIDEVIASGEVPSSGKGTIMGLTTWDGALTNVFAMTNSSSVQLNISSLTTNGANPAEFTVLNAPSVIDGNTVSNFTVIYDPNMEGRHTASLVVSNDSLFDSTYTMNLKAGTELSIHWISNIAGGIYFPDGICSNRLNEGAMNISFQLNNLIEDGIGEITFNKYTDSTNGTWQLAGLNDGQSFYTPNPGFYGNDFFSFTVTQTLPAVALTGYVHFVVNPKPFTVTINTTNSDTMVALTNTYTIYHGDTSTYLITYTNLDWNLDEITLNGSTVELTNYNDMSVTLTNVQTNAVINVVAENPTPPSFTVVPTNNSIISGCAAFTVMATLDAKPHEIALLDINRARTSPGSVLYMVDNATLLSQANGGPYSSVWTNFAITNIDYNGVTREWTFCFNTTNYNDWDSYRINGDYDIRFVVEDEAGDRLTGVYHYVVNNNPASGLAFQSTAPVAGARLEQSDATFTFDVTNLLGNAVASLSVDITGPLFGTNSASIQLPANTTTVGSSDFFGWNYALNGSPTYDADAESWSFTVRSTNETYWPSGEYRMDATVYDVAGKSTSTTLTYIVNQQGSLTNDPAYSPSLASFTPPTNTLLQETFTLKINADSNGTHSISQLYLDLYGPLAHDVNTNKQAANRIQLYLPADNFWITNNIGTLNAPLSSLYNGRNIGLQDAGYDPYNEEWTLLFQSDNSTATIWDDYDYWEFVVQIEDTGGNQYGSTNMLARTNNWVRHYYPVSNKQELDIQFWSDWGGGYAWSTSNQFVSVVEYTNTPHLVTWGSNVTVRLDITNGWHVLSNIVNGVTEPASNNNVSATNNLALGMVTNPQTVRIYMDIDRFSLAITSDYDVISPSIGQYENQPWTSQYNIVVEESFIFRTDYRGVTNERSSYISMNVLNQDDNGTVMASTAATNYLLTELTNNTLVEVSWQSEYKFVVDSSTDLVDVQVFINDAAPVTNYNGYLTNDTAMRIVAINIDANHEFLYWQDDVSSTVFNTNHDYSFIMDGPLSLRPILAYTNSSAISVAVSGGGTASEMPWSTFGDTSWFVQTNVYYSNDVNTSAAQSGAIDDGEESVLESDVVGPASLSFWWKVESEAGGDYLQFLIGTQLVQAISGNKDDWAQVEVDLSAGPNSLRWRYIKDSTGSIPADAGWIDNVVLTRLGDLSLTITPAAATTQATWRLTQGMGSWTNPMMSGDIALNVPEGPNVIEFIDTPGWVEPNNMDVIVTRSALTNITVLYHLAEVVTGTDNDYLNWSLGGDKEWYSQTNVYYNDGDDAAQSGPILANQQSVMQGLAPVDGMIGFWYKTDSEEDFDMLTFEIGSQTMLTASGKERPWIWAMYGVTGAGPHTLTWTYSKDVDSDVGSDSVWVDLVSYYVPLDLSYTTGGSVLGATNEQWFMYGSSLIVTAMPDPQIVFQGWKEAGVLITTNQVLNTLIDWTNVYAAVFVPQAYTSGQYSVPVPHDWMTNFFPGADPDMLQGQVTNFPTGSPYTYQEHYIMGVSPTQGDPTVNLITNIAPDVSSNNVINWYAQTGQWYAIDFSTNLMSDPFELLLGATNLPATVILTPQHVSYTDTVNQTSESIFYRIRVRLKD